MYQKNTSYRSAVFLRLVHLFILLAVVPAVVNAQRMNFNARHVTIKQLLEELRRQNNSEIVVSSDLIRSTHEIDVDVKNATTEEVLQRFLSRFNLAYKVDGKTIIITARESNPVPPSPVDTSKPLKGAVSSLAGKLESVTVINRRTGEVAITAANGIFILHDAADADTVQLTMLGYEKLLVKAADIRKNGQVMMTTAANGLDVVSVLAYGQHVSRRTNTGSSVKVTAEEIEKTATANPILALQGRVAGMNVNITSGLPGAHPKVQIRGVNTLNMDGRAQNPLYIVDGVPFPANSLAVVSNNGTTYSGAYDSPLKSIDPSSIATIEVLKDADATAIYGARGANGVILITTKKGKPGPLALDVDVYTSSARIAKKINMMNTAEYLQMRREAAANDGITPTAAAYPDLFKWSQTAYTDWQQAYLNRSAHTTNAEVNVSGGTSKTRYLVGAGFRKEMTIYDLKNGLMLGNGRANISHQSANNKFRVSGIANFSTDKNDVAAINPSEIITLPPNYSPYNEDGTLNWDKSNPLATTLKTTKNKSRNIQLSVSPEYWFTEDLKGKVMMGYSDTRLDQTYISPIASQNPNNSPKGQATFVNGSVRSYTVEPQLDYHHTWKKHGLTALLGGTYIVNKSATSSNFAFGFPADSLMGDIKNAAAIDSNKTAAMYKFLSGFTRLGYNYNNTYIVNLTFRRDGSSRFAPANRYGNFWSVGAAWVLSEEKWVRNHLPLFNLLKLRGSYGITGNDNIGDYKYFVNYLKTYGQYETYGLSPTNLFNDTYRWEENKKADVALETTMFSNRLSVDVNYYVNKSGNQLVEYPLGTQTGFGSVVMNLGAVVQNSGWEFTVSGTPLKDKKLLWNSRLNISLQRNKLLSFPGLANSSYNTIYAIGRPLSLYWGFEFLGIDPATGAPVVRDQNRDGAISYPADYSPLMTSLPACYGGLGNTFNYGNISLDVFFSFKINRYGPPISMPTGGDITNMPVYFLQRWKAKGDETEIPAYTTSSSKLYGYNSSGAIIKDASYIRLSSLSLSYNFSANVLKRLHIRSLRLYATGNNLFTITRYPGLDPEAGMYMPPLRSFSFGLRTQI